MSVPKPGQYGEPWHEEKPTSPLAWYELYRSDGAIGPGDGGRPIGAVVGTYAPRIVACIDALNGRDPEALHELEEAAKDAEAVIRLSQCVPSVEEKTRVVIRLRAALKAFGVWS